MQEKKIHKKQIIVAVSGGWDPIHVGHIRLMEEAKKLGDKLVVIINNDNWLKKKKGFVFMPQHERKEVIKALRSVDRVIFTKHPPNPKDMSISRELQNLRPHVFANGGDRNKKDAANPNSSLYKDIRTCEKVGIEIVYNVGKGGKVQSSSWLLSKYFERAGSGTKNTKKRNGK